MSQSDSLDQLGSIWYHSEPPELSDSTNEYRSGTFLDTQYNKPALVPSTLAAFFPPPPLFVLQKLRWTM